MRSLFQFWGVILLTIIPGYLFGEVNQCEYPNVMMILDKSTSMGPKVSGGGGYIDGKTKWTIAVESLGNLLNHFDASLDFGLMIYPSDVAGEGGNRCHEGNVLVDIGRGTKEQILALSQLSSQPQDNAFTPTYQTLLKAQQIASLQNPAKRNYIVLITDGEQYCHCYSYPDPSSPVYAYYHLEWCIGTGTARQEHNPVEAIKALKELNISTYVIGFGAQAENWIQNLNEMAYYGGTAQEGCYTLENGQPVFSAECFYPATQLTELNAALNQIARQITEETCDGKDNNCNGSIDEGLSRACETECGTGFEYCVEGGTGTYTACDAPQPVEFDCGNRIVTICPGQVPPCDCVPGETKPCGSSDQGECEFGVATCQPNYTWGTCVGALVPVTEVCDGKDNNCDGQVDEGDLCENGMACLCGGCQEPCVFGECFNGERCIDGYCVVDMCPDGMYCAEGECVPGEKTNTDSAPDEYPDIPTEDTFEGLSMSPVGPDGCGCGLSAAPSLPAFFFYILLIPMFLFYRRFYK